MVNDEIRWVEAKVKCQEDGAELACFSNQQERDAVSDKWNECWVGYTWQSGKFRCIIFVFSGV